MTDNSVKILIEFQMSAKFPRTVTAFVGKDGGFTTAFPERLEEPMNARVNADILEKYLIKMFMEMGKINTTEVTTINSQKSVASKRLYQAIRKSNAS